MLPLLRRSWSRHCAQNWYTCSLRTSRLQYCPTTTPPIIYRQPLASIRNMASVQEQHFGEWAKKYDARKHSAERDFRSDTVTLPTSAMFSAILENAQTLGDDVLSEDQPTNDLEKYIADLTGMPHALFVSSGTMGNQLALRVLLTQPPHSVILGETNHVSVHECGMAAILSQAQLNMVSYKLPQRSYLTLEDLKPHFVPDDGEIHSSPTKVVSLENTWQGCIMPVAEVARISKWAHDNGMKVHMDGARLWNACYPSSDTAANSPKQAIELAKKTLREYCSHVDSVTMCFSKSLGAPVGSILCGTTPEFLAKARHFRKAMGGGTRQVGILTAAARVAVDDVFLSGALIRANAFARQLHEKWVSLGGRSKPGLEQQTNMVWLDLAYSKVTDVEFTSLLKEEGLAGNPGRIVTHHQISEDAVEAMKRVFEKAATLGREKGDGVVVDNQSFSYAAAANGEH